MTRLRELWEKLKLNSDLSSLTEEQIQAILPVLEQEADARRVKQIHYILKRSGIKSIKRFEDFDWLFNPTLPRQEIMAFRASPWREEARNLLLVGSTGVGKSHIASSLCYETIQKALPATFLRCYDLVGKLKRARNKHAMIQYYSTVNVLCLDELGYVFPTQEEANDIFQIISKRSENLPTIVTTNLVPSQWGKLFESATATAILDRLNMKGTFLTMEGPSYRGAK